MSHVYCEKCGNVYHEKAGLCPSCFGKGKVKPKAVLTNYTRIKNMSVEDMADFIDNITSNSPCTACCDNLNQCLRNNNIERICKNHYISWLNQPAESEGK